MGCVDEVKTDLFEKLEDLVVKDVRREEEDGGMWYVVRGTW